MCALRKREERDMLWMLIAAVFITAILFIPIRLEARPMERRGAYIACVRLLGVTAIRRTLYVHMRRHVRPVVLLVRRGGGFKRLYTFSPRDFIHEKKRKKNKKQKRLFILRVLELQLQIGVLDIAVTSLVCGVLRIISSAILPHLPEGSSIEILPRDSEWEFKLKVHCIIWVIPWNIICKLIKKALENALNAMKKIKRRKKHEPDRNSSQNDYERA